MRIKLKSNWTDCYDHWFDGEGIEWHRFSNNGYSKQDQFRMLKRAGYNIPPIGKAGELLDTYFDDDKLKLDFGYRPMAVVSYEDEMLHNGEGKNLVTKSHFSGQNLSRMDEKIKKYNTFSSAFVFSNKVSNGVSYRHLQIGKNVFWLKYWSDTDWRSNCGDGGCKVLNSSLNEGYHRTFKLPLFAIDFVEGISGTLYAIDFNNAPGISKSGVEYIFPPKLIAESLKDAILKFSNLGAGAAVQKTVFVNK